MAKVVLNKVTWVQIHTVGTTERVQVMAGRIYVADSAAPAFEDYHSYPSGAVIDMTANKWALAQDNNAYVVTAAV